MLAPYFRYLRMYDAGPHAETALKVVADDGLDLKIMLGMAVQAEVNNPNCPWGGVYSADTLTQNAHFNDAELGRLIDLAQTYAPHILALSVGNEATVDWNDHMAPVPRLIGFARKLKTHTGLPVTFCENYVPWAHKLKPLGAELDVISVHTYPVWEHKSIDAALDYTKANYYGVKHHYPGKPVIITEAGWTTRANGLGIDAQNASQALQADYIAQLIDWTRRDGILTFLFEAFDEPWKGGDHPDEPEKHWGLWGENRVGKRVVETVLDVKQNREQNRR